jgi:hypothetical protein
VDSELECAYMHGWCAHWLELDVGDDYDMVG